MAIKRRKRTRSVARQEQTIPKEPLAREIRRLVTEKGLSQAETAAIVQDAASQLSLLLSGKLANVIRDVRALTRVGGVREVDEAENAGAVILRV